MSKKAKIDAADRRARLLVAGFLDRFPSTFVFHSIAGRWLVREIANAIRQEKDDKQ